MSRVRTLLGDRRGAAAAEMALVTPLLVLLMLGSVELGNYFMNEHALVKAVRDGARFAARQGFENFQTCDVAPSGTVASDALAVTRTGRVSGGTDRLPNWNSATFTVTTRCSTGAGTVTYGGIYAGQAGGARFVAVTAELPYRAVIASFGLGSRSLKIRANQQAAVAGI